MTARVHWSVDAEAWLIICEACFLYDCHHSEADAELKAIGHNHRAHRSGKRTWRARRDAA